MQAYVISQLLQVVTVTTMTLNTYYAIYNLGDIVYMSLLSIPNLIALLLSSVFVPKMAKKADVGNLIFYLSILAFIVGIIYYFTGYNNITLVFIMTTISTFISSLITILTTIFLVDSIDFAEWKTGFRTDGLIFSIQSLTAKVMQAFGSFVTGVILTIIGFQTDAKTQSTHTMQGIFFVIAIGVTVSMLIGSIPLVMSKYKGDFKKNIQKELAARRNK